MRQDRLSRLLALGAVCLLMIATLASVAVGQERNQGRNQRGGQPGRQHGTTVQLPTFGISIDADGVLEFKTFEDPTGLLMKQRLQAAQMALGQNDVAAASPMRMISLRKLEAAVARRLAAGQDPTDEMKNLAGLQRAQFVFCYPDQNDIIIAGPAEGWMDDLAGRAVGITSRRPTVQLVDLVTALRAFPAEGDEPRLVGCSIGPTQEGLQNLSKFQAQIPNQVGRDQEAAVGAWVYQGMREALGLATISVFGVPETTHFGQVLVEADYRMKMIGVGLEPTGIRLRSYAELVSGARHGILQRWWFYPNYEMARVTEDLLAMELVGQGVMLSSEDLRFDTAGKLGGGRRANGASERFTKGFTDVYEELSEIKPIYAQLRNLIDLTVAAAFIKRAKFYEQAEWTPATFAQEEQFSVETNNAPRQVPVAANALWKNHRLFVMAGGGVSIQPSIALDSEHLLADEDGELDSRRQRLLDGLDDNPDHWWWD